MLTCHLSLSTLPYEDGFQCIRATALFLQKGEKLILFQKETSLLQLQTRIHYLSSTESSSKLPGISGKAEVREMHKMCPSECKLRKWTVAKNPDFIVWQRKYMTTPGRKPWSVLNERFFST